MSEPDAGASLPESPYDPELPFLEELEHEIGRRALRAARAGGLRRAPAGVAAGFSTGAVTRGDRRGGSGDRRGGGDRRRASSDCDDGGDEGPRGRAPLASRGGGAARRGSTTRRVARRSLTLVALLCLLAATAFATRTVLAGSTGNPTEVQRGRLVAVAAGGGGAERWALRLYRRGGELCRTLAVGEAEASRCSPSPAPGGLGVTSVVSPRRRYLFGVGGDAVARVEVRAGALTQTVATGRLAAPEAAAGGLPRGTRYFVSVIARPSVGADPPALVQPLDAAGRPLGPARVDCVETAQPQPCRP